MKRLEQIKRRFELNLSSPKEYGHLMSNPEANIEYLIGLLEQAEKALNDIADSKYITIVTVRKLAEEALQAIRKGD